MKKILVTGASGFIGKYLLDYLLKQGHQVVASARNQPTSVSLNQASGLQWIPLDLAHLNASTNYFDYFERPDSLIHLAWSGLPNYNAAFHLSTELPIQIRFLENLLTNGLQDITVAGTCLEYGLQEGCLSESQSTQPVTPYGQAKNQLRLVLESLQKTRHFSFKWLRLFYLYGTGQSPKSLFSQLEAALAAGETSFNMSGGQQVRDFLAVDQMAKRIATIAVQNEITGIVNCCSGVPVKVEDFVRSYLSERNKSIQLNLGVYPYPDYEPMCFWGDTKKLNTIIKYE